jgi:2-polyprenyl-6-methoxyphenol hydroxylase-like FAD-dependent oxidoreductase
VSPPRLAIAGAGPAGLVAAIAARRLGLEVDVFEQAAGLRPVGGGLFLHSNGLRVLDALGLLAGLEPALRPSRVIAIELADGRRISTFDYSQLAIPHNCGAVLLRYRLQEQLVTAAERAGARFHFGCRVTGAGWREGRVGAEALLHFAGGQACCCDAVVGADGVDSRLRESAGIPALHTAAGEAYLRGVAARETPEDTVREIWGQDCRRFGICPLPGAFTYFYASVPVGGWEAIRTGGLSAWIEGWSRYGPEVLALLRSVADWGAVNYDELRELEAESWVRPPLFLVGDAVHAMLPNLGQGANSAMVDGLVLVRLLAPALRAGEDLDAVGRRFEEVRRPFVRSIQASSRRLGLVSADASARERFVTQALSAAARAPLAPRTGAAIPAAGYNPLEEQFFEPLA